MDRGHEQGDEVAERPQSLEDDCTYLQGVKTGSEGSIERYKARLVAQGFNQKYGFDYDETFCPVVRQESLRTLVALSTQRGLELHHVDVATAFLNGTLQEGSNPRGTRRKEKSTWCASWKRVYGLKQFPRCW